MRPSYARVSPGFSPPRALLPLSVLLALVMLAAPALAAGKVLVLAPQVKPSGSKELRDKGALHPKEHLMIGAPVFILDVGQARRWLE